MDSLPKSFTKPNSNGWNPEVDLSKKITFGLRVDTVEEDKDGITVKGRNRATSQKMKCTGDAVILTLPLQILRQMNIDFPTDKQKALANITYSQGRVKHDMRIAKKTRYKRVQNALISIAFLRFANALTNAPIKWLHKNAKIAFVRVFRFSQSELRFHFAFLRANAFAI